MANVESIRNDGLIRDNGQPCYMETHQAVLLIAGCTLMALTETMTGTAMPFVRLGLPGDVAATADEFSLLDQGYTAAKLVGFIAAPWLLSGLPILRGLKAFALVMIAACGLMPYFIDVNILTGLRIIQGLSGGILLIGAQSLLFISFTREKQAVIQGVYALGSVVAPVAFAPMMQGWLVEMRSWSWVFFLALAFAALSIAMLSFVTRPEERINRLERPDLAGFTLFTGAAVCIVYLSQRGSRWNGFDSFHIMVIALAAVLFIAGFILSQATRQDKKPLVPFAVFNSNDFTFAFCISFVAGCVLSSSTSTILNFGLGTLGMTAASMGRLLLSSGIFAAVSLLLMAFLIHRRIVPPIASVPFGIALIMSAMWLLSGSTNQAGPDSMWFPLALRGLGFGFLFLAMTVIAFPGLKGRALLQGVALFALGRQIGGTAGSGFIQRYVDHQQALNKTVLAAHIGEDGEAVAQMLAATADVFKAQGVEPLDAGRQALALLKQTLDHEAAIISYNEAFLMLALVFVVCAPVLGIVKKALSKRNVK